MKAQVVTPYIKNLFIFYLYGGEGWGKGRGGGVGGGRGEDNVFSTPFRRRYMGVAKEVEAYLQNRKQSD
jgi:hypothetical protein